MSETLQMFAGREWLLIPLAITITFGIMFSAFKAIRSINIPMYTAAQNLDKRLTDLQRSVDGLREAQMAGFGVSASAAGNDIDIVADDTKLSSPQTDPTDYSRYETDPNLAIATLVRNRNESLVEIARDALRLRLKNPDATLSVDEQLAIYNSLLCSENKTDDRIGLIRTTAAQLESTSNTKSAMISLFIMFNLGVVGALIFAPVVVTAGKELILGLYISLATFIFYVYRAANARALVLLAIKEDLKRSHDAERYINTLRPKTSPSDRDIDILKLILLNRAERELHSEHPYELVLKGVTNSNILLRGGKVANVQSKRKDKEE